jgi:stage II sporulation protein GA (sporulation sigma-E factor processing peptidase)
MVTVIYIDVLIFVNMIINYFQILITAFFTGQHRKRGRIAIAAIAGSFFSLVILLPGLHFIVSLIVKLLGALLMAGIGYGFNSARKILRNTAYLFLASTVLAGLVLGFTEFSKSDIFVINNLGIYIDLSPLTLIIAALVCYIVLTAIDFFFKRPGRLPKNRFAQLAFNGKVLSFDAMIDSGHKLYDVLSGRDVIILQEHLADKILSPQQLAALHKSRKGEITAQDLNEIRDFALLPFTSVGGAGMMLGFGAAYCDVKEQNGKTIRIEKPFVAFAENQLLGDTEGLVGSDALEV